MGIGMYSLKADGDKKVSANFKVREFKCNDGSDKILISAETVSKLQAAADYFKKPIHINSAYRTPTYNKKVGGASQSQHVKGTACDIRVDGVPPVAVAAFFEAKYPQSGIGLYNNFVHIDSRGRKSYWKNSGSNVVSSFKLGEIYKNYKGDDMDKIEVQNIAEKVIDDYFNTLKAAGPSDWSKNGRAFCESEGLITGDANGNMRYKSYVTREELAVILERFYNLIKSR